MTSSHQSNQAEIGMVGLGVMGRNLLLNMAGHGFSVAGYDQDSEQVAALEREPTTHAVRGTTDIKEFIGMLRSPRAVMPATRSRAVRFARVFRGLFQRLVASQSHPGPARLFRRALL